MGQKDKDRDRMRQSSGRPDTARGDQPGQEQPENRTTRDYEQGDATRPAQPDGTTPLERDTWPINQKR